LLLSRLVVICQFFSSRNCHTQRTSTSAAAASSSSMPATILQHRFFDGATELNATASAWHGSSTHSSRSVPATTSTPSSAAAAPRPSIVVPNPNPDHPRKSVVAYWDGQGYVVSLETTTESDTTETESEGASLPRFVPSDTSSEDYTTDDDEDFASDAESFCGEDPDENSSNSDSSIDEEKKKYEYGDARPSLSSNNTNSNNNKDSTPHQTATAKTNPFATLPASSMCAPSPYYRRASVQRRNSTSNTSLRHTVHGSSGSQGAHRPYTTNTNTNWTNNYNGHGSTGTRYRTDGQYHYSNNTNTVHRQQPSFPPRSHHRYHPNNIGAALPRRSAPRRHSNEEHYSQYATSSAPRRRRSSMGPWAAVPTPALATGPPPGFSLPGAAEEEEVVRDPWDCLDLQMLHALDHEGRHPGPERQRRHGPTPPATAAVAAATASSDSTDTTTKDACLRGLNWEMEPSYLYEVAKLSQLDSTVLEHKLDAFLFGRHRRASM